VADCSRNLFSLLFIVLSYRYRRNAIARIRSVTDRGEFLLAPTGLWLCDDVVRDIQNRLLGAEVLLKCFWNQCQYFTKPLS